MQELTPPKRDGKATLLRGQDKQADYEFDHYLGYRETDRKLGFIDGDQEMNLCVSGQQLFNQSIEPHGMETFAVVGDGQRTRYFINGVLVGEISQRDQSDLYYVGNSSGDELFAEYMDDLRVYGVSLAATEIGKIYGGDSGICLHP